MAVHDTSDNAQTTNTNTAAASAQQQPQQPRRSSPVAATSFGLMNQMTNFGTGGDTFEKIYSKISALLKGVNEEQKATNPNTTLQAVKLLKTKAGLNYSAVVVCQATEGNVAAHILMVEKTGQYPDRRTETVGTERYEIVRTPADALDEKFVTAAQRAVGAVMNVPAEAVIIVDGTLVPNEFDAENDQAVVCLLSNALNAVASELAIRVNDFKGTNLMDIIGNNRNGKFYVSLYFNGEDASYIDASGMPIRQDVCVSLTYKANTQGNNRSINQGEETFEISKVYGYVDFEYTGPKVINGTALTQRYVPNFIITDIEAGNAPTPDLLMLAVASVLSLSEDMNWIQAFRPTPARKNEIDYNDIGALNIEGNIEQSPTGFGKKYDTKSKTVTTVELNRLLQTLVHPTMMISMDLPKAGPKAWATSVFGYIKMYQNPAAVQRMRDFMNTATNGAFANVASNAPMFEDTGNKIHGGYYKSKDGFKDIRHLSSYLAVANFCADTNQQPATLSQYTNTLYALSIPQELRAATRRAYIDEMSGRTAVFKQMYDRVTFNSEFLRGWLMALRSVGFSPIFSNMGETNDMFVKRATVDFSGAMLGQDMRLMGASNNLYGSWQNVNNYVRNF